MGVDVGVRTTANIESNAAADELIDRRTIARLLGVSIRTIDRWHRQRIGPPRTVLGHRVVRYRRNALATWTSNSESVANSDDPPNRYLHKGVPAMRAKNSEVPHVAGFDEGMMAEVMAARARSINSPFVSITDLARELGVSIRTMRRRQAAGELPNRIRRGRKLMYLRSAAAALVKRAALREGLSTGHSGERA